MRLVPICFVLGMLNFAYAVDFDIPEMFSYLGAQPLVGAVGARRSWAGGARSSIRCRTSATSCRA